MASSKNNFVTTATTKWKQYFSEDKRTIILNTNTIKEYQVGNRGYGKESLSKQTTTVEVTKRILLE